MAEVDMVGLARDGVGSGGDGGGGSGSSSRLEGMVSPAELVREGGAAGGRRGA